MKILMPYVDSGGRSITDTKVSGGTELFSRKIVENFDVIPVEIPWKTDNAENKFYKQKIIETAEEHGVDVILSNNIKSLACYAIRDIGIPIMHITHTNYNILTCNEILCTMAANGHSIYSVSESNRNYFQKRATRLKEPAPNILGTIQPSYADTSLPLNTSIDKSVITVGRSTPYKGPFIVYKMCEGTEYKPVVVTSVGAEPESVEYYERNKGKPHHIGLPHGEVMDLVSRSTVSVITCPIETFGIFALESLSLGVPLVIRTDKTGTHASTEIATSPEHYRTIRELSESGKLFDQLAKVDRKEISESTREKHSKENWKQSIAVALQQTIDRYTEAKKNISTLDEFF
jgi:glycosyltransferase involved in cell wall biosynthesis